MILVGLTGGVASGKSLVSQYFRRFGASVIDADLIAHRVIAPGKPAWGAIRLAFGSEILKPDKTIDRQKLGEIVFGNPKKLKTLNAIVHPRVFEEEDQLKKKIVRRRPRAVIIFDAALLIEAGSYRRMDKVILVTVDQATQISRLMKRNGLSRAEAKRRIASQAPNAHKRKYADYIIDGRGTPKAIERQVRSLYQELRALT